MSSDKLPRIIMQGDLILAKDVSTSPGNPNPPPRSEVKGFSSSSRRNMIKQCATLGRSIPIFVTLTYPKTYPSDPKEWKRHLDVWGKRLIRRHPNYAAVWRIEPQKRGAPHYHLLVYRDDGKKPFLCMNWIAKSWSDVLGEYSNEDHLNSGTRVETLKSSRGAAFYTAKYCAKITEDDDYPTSWDRIGRHWGSFNKKCLPFAKQHDHYLHSELEQKAVLFTMKDAFHRAFIKRKASEYVKLGDDPSFACHQAEQDWKDALENNPHFGNTTTFYGDANKFMQFYSSKLVELQLQISKHLKEPLDGSRISDLVDKIARAF